MTFEAAPDQFYTGIVADIYRHLRGATPDPVPYERFVRRYGEPALELGCGDGDPLLDLIAAGLEVEGLDSSADMLDRCRAAAESRGCDVVLHLTSIEDMDLGRRYRSLYFAGPTFNLLVDDAAAAAALRSIDAHLDDEGVAMVPIFEPALVEPDSLGRLRERCLDDGVVVRVGAIAQERDEANRVQSTTLRYELETADGVEVLERSWVLHWHSVGDLRKMAAAAGLRIRRALAGDATEAADDATSASILFERTSDV